MAAKTATKLFTILFRVAFISCHARSLEVFCVKLEKICRKSSQLANRKRASVTVQCCNTAVILRRRKTSAVDVSGIRESDRDKILRFDRDLAVSRVHFSSSSFPPFHSLILAPTRMSVLACDVNETNPCFGHGECTAGLCSCDVLYSIESGCGTASPPPILQCSYFFFLDDWHRAF